MHVRSTGTSGGHRTPFKTRCSNAAFLLQAGTNGKSKVSSSLSTPQYLDTSGKKAYHRRAALGRQKILVHSMTMQRKGLLLAAASSQAARKRTPKLSVGPWYELQNNGESWPPRSIIFFRELDQNLTSKPTHIVPARFPSPLQHRTSVHGEP